MINKLNRISLFFYHRIIFVCAPVFIRVRARSRVCVVLEWYAVLRETRATNSQGISPCHETNRWKEQHSKREIHTDRTWYELRNMRHKQKRRPNEIQATTEEREKKIHFQTGRGGEQRCMAFSHVFANLAACAVLELVLRVLTGAVLDGDACRTQFDEERYPQSHAPKRQSRPNAMLINHLMIYIFLNARRHRYIAWPSLTKHTFHRNFQSASTRIPSSSINRTSLMLRFGCVFSGYDCVTVRLRGGGRIQFFLYVTMSQMHLVRQGQVFFRLVMREWLCADTQRASPGGQQCRCWPPPSPTNDCHHKIRFTSRN